MVSTIEMRANDSFRLRAGIFGRRRREERSARNPLLDYSLLFAGLTLLAVLLFGCSPLPTGQAVRVSDVTLFSDMECLRIETPAATYYYGKRGAGFARIVDPDGHDWISYRPGNKARGEYRGLPKCGQPVKYFHCGYGFGQYTNDNPFTTTFERIAPGHVHVHSETRDGVATCDWDFFPMHATLTLRRCGTNAFWFL